MISYLESGVIKSFAMNSKLHFQSIYFRNFKGFDNYFIALREFNVLVGPNNSGKSTIIGAIRILFEGIRRARARNPELLDFAGHTKLGYRVSLSEVPIATENVFHNYDDSHPAEIDFVFTNKSKLKLMFPRVGLCFMACETLNKVVRSTSDFKKEFNVDLGFVPVLGPVEHDEPLYQEEAARRALLTHRASRNFRNIWYHYREEFSEFRRLIQSTWPGMDIELPSIESYNPPILHMFCPEDRYPREIYWAGFGFQVWCQMLTFIVRSKNVSLFVVDEPDIYLHSDLQKQLVNILKNLGPDILIATHSIEIISEVEPEDLLLVNKKHRSAKRIKTR
ncbi:MAG: ATP-binding protein [Deltaproteobacteria bacterium]|nr:ATP-binding protein [Deltaproteobacteria bacterium]